MKSDKPKLIIHTTIAPETSQKPSTLPPRRAIWHNIKPPSLSIKKRLKPHQHNKLTHGERLLRNTAIACAALMGVIGLSKIDTPITNRVSQTVSSVVSMRMNLDDTLGRLNFVREWMPDTALVFWNMGAGNALARPVTGALTHAFDVGQPWLEYQVKGEQAVYAALSGTVAAISENDRNEWTILVDHEDGEQTVYAYLGKVIVKTAQQVQRGAQLGVTANEDPARMYFELRVQGAPINPIDRMAGA